jgi:hypothetical protein
MEIVLFLAILSVCPISTGNCLSPDDWVRYISPPFEIERHMLQDPVEMQKKCTIELDKLRVSLDMEPPYNNLCVNEEIWRKHHPEYE